ncbi:hypothetical protein BGZ94_006815 [Podila epigama]|nr:hypothetical protein BGZ94_006815 [Podila epigama]
MLLLVPSNKTDEDSPQKATSPTRGRVLVVLPPDTDISSNVILPDTAITNTLITIDSNSPDSVNDLTSPSLQRHSNKLYFLDPSSQNNGGIRDHLGILQSEGLSPHHPWSHTPAIAPPNTQQGRQGDSVTSTRYPSSSSTGLYPSANDTISRTRRHSHSGLIEVDHLLSQGHYSRNRSKTRQSFSQATPYQQHPSLHLNTSSVRTPRALRAALRKARKDQSPLLTSASFGTDYSQPRLDLDDLDEDAPTTAMDAFKEWREDQLKLHPQQEQQHYRHLGASHSPEIVYLGTHGSMRGLASEGELSTKSLGSHQSGVPALGKADDPSAIVAEQLSQRTDAHRRSVSDDIEIDIEGMEEDPQPRKKKPGNFLPSDKKRLLNDSQESLDIVGVSDEEMEPTKAKGSPSKDNATFIQPSNSEELPSQESAPLPLDEGDTYDADMDLILGMASDMDLVMPQFDDEYLDDLKNDTTLTLAQGMKLASGSAHSATSPVSSHSSSSTITCVSALHSPASRSLTPRVGFPTETLRQESPPTSPTTIAARKHALDPYAPASTIDELQKLPLMGHLPHSRQDTSVLSSNGQGLSTIHKDIDNLKRHRDSLREIADMNNLTSPKGSSTPSSLSVSTSSSSSSSSQSNEKKATQAPLYFKPTHHSQSDRPGAGGEHAHQNVIIIQSSQWNPQLQQRPGSFGVLPAHSQPQQQQQQQQQQNQQGQQQTERQQIQQQPHQTQGNVVRGGFNEGNQIFIVREATSSPPPHILDKSVKMTTNNISLATANMNVLTPREVQEDYYAKRDMQRMYQRLNRRRSSVHAMTGTSAAAAAAATAAMVTSRLTTTPHGPLHSSIPSPLRRDSVSPNVPSQPIERRHSAVAALMTTSTPKSIGSTTVATTAPLLPLPQSSRQGQSQVVPLSYYIPPSAFRTAADVAAEKEAEQKRRKEEEELKDAFLVFPSPTLS